MSSKTLSHRFAQVMLISASSCFLIGAGITLLDIFVRALFHSHVDASIELTTLFIGLGALLSMPVTFSRKGHITAKLLSEFLPAKIGYWLAVFGAGVSLLFSLILLIAEYLTAYEKFGSPETTPDTGTPVSILLIIITITLFMAFCGAVIALVNSITETAANEGADHG